MMYKTFLVSLLLAGAGLADQCAHKCIPNSSCPRSLENQSCCSTKHASGVLICHRGKWVGTIGCGKGNKCCCTGLNDNADITCDNRQFGCFAPGKRSLFLRESPALEFVARDVDEVEEPAAEAFTA